MRPTVCCEQTHLSISAGVFSQKYKEDYHHKRVSSGVKTVGAAHVDTTAAPRPLIGRRRVSSFPGGWFDATQMNVSRPQYRYFDILWANIPVAGNMDAHLDYLTRPSRKFWSKFCTFPYFFYWRKFILKVWLITFQKIMSLRAREPPQNRGYVCIIGIHKFTSSKLWGRFSQLFVFPKLGSFKRIELSQFLCYSNDSHIKT